MDAMTYMKRRLEQFEQQMKTFAVFVGLDSPKQVPVDNLDHLMTVGSFHNLYNQPTNAPTTNYYKLTVTRLCGYSYVQTIIDETNMSYRRVFANGRWTSWKVV